MTQTSDDRVTTPARRRSLPVLAWDRPLSADRPTLLDVGTDPNMPPIPPHATFEQVKDSALAMLGDEGRRGVVVKGVKTQAQEMLPHHPGSK